MLQPARPYVRLLYMDDVRITSAVAVVLRQFLNDPDEPRYGYDLMQTTGFPSGKLYPILSRLETAGWLTKEREDIDPVAEGRPARRMYRITGAAIPAARAELAALSAQVSPPGEMKLRPIGGIA